MNRVRDRYGVPLLAAVGVLVVAGIVAAVWRPWGPRLPAVTTPLTAFPSDIVDAVLYLESAGFVTGEILHVDGGQSAGH